LRRARVTLEKSRVRESRTLGSVRAKAEWLSYSTCAGLTDSDLRVEVPSG
jgi:hypothetical protein